MNVAVVWFVGLFGLVRIVVSGATVSTIQVCEAGVGSTFPAGSTARTWNVCEPSARLKYPFPGQAP